MIKYKDQSGVLTKEPVWGIGSWLYSFLPVLVSALPIARRASDLGAPC